MCCRSAPSEKGGQGVKDGKDEEKKEEQPEYGVPEEKKNPSFDVVS